MSKISNTIINQYEEIQKLKIDSVVRKNGDFALVDNLKELIINNYFKEQDNLWDFFNTASEDFAQILYEAIVNMLENVGDVDLCTLDDLKNIGELLGINNLALFTIPFSDELTSLIDTYSVNKEYVLYGRHSTTDIETVFGVTDWNRELVVDTTGMTDEEAEAAILAETIAQVERNKLVNNAYMSELVDTSFKEVLLNMLYDPTSVKGQEHIGIIELITPNEYLGTEYDYLIGVRDGTVDRLNDADHYALLNTSDMLDIDSKFLRNFCLRVLLFRENLKSIAQKNAILGTQKIIEKMLTEYVIKGYSNIEDFGFYVPIKTAEESLDIGVNNDSFRSWTRFLKSVTDLGSLLDIQVVEYYDNTEYMNIGPSARPYIINQVPVYELYSEPYLTASGTIAYKAPVSIITGYQDIVSSEYAKPAGNERFWETNSTESDNETILAMFTRLGLITAEDDIDVLMAFLSKLYNNNAPNDWSELASTDYATSSDLANMQTKYINNITGYVSNSPWVNAKSVDYPTKAPIPWMWNLIEKAFLTFPRLIQYYTEKTTTFGDNYTNYIDIDGSKGYLYSPSSSGTIGMIIDSWRSSVNDYFSYESYYETENNLDNTNATNKNAQIDGSFNMLALGDLLSVYDSIVFSPSGSFTLATGAIVTNLQKYYENL